MQPFGVPKNPKMSVQTKKPPVQRYPNPYSTPSQPQSNPVGSAQKKIGTNPFAEENNSVPFDIAQSFGTAGGFEENDVPLQTPERFPSDGYNQHHRDGNVFEETPAAFGRGGQFAGHENANDEISYQDDRSATDVVRNFEAENERSEPPQNVHGQKLASPNKRILGGRDDDEYVRVESGDEQEEDPEIRNKNEIPRGTPIKAQKPAAFAHQNVAENYVPRSQQNLADTDALLQIKRLELELAKERQRADFYEGEQNKLIEENTELRRRTEELNAQVDLAKRYDSSERLARKEEEVERLRIELNGIGEEKRMLEEHYQRLLNENNGYRNESDSLIYSIQEENRRLQEEVQHLRREMDVRVGSKINIVQEKNDLLEQEVTDLRQQIQVLTEQLTLKAQYDQRVAGFNQEIDTMVSNLTKSTAHTQTHVAPVHTQVSQTSPTKIQGATIETQTQGNVELNEAQTSPIKFPGQFRPPSVQTTSPNKFDNQSAPKSAVKICPSPSKIKTPGMNTPERHLHPFGQQPGSASQTRPAEEQQLLQVPIAAVEANNDFLDSFKVEGEEEVPPLPVQEKVEDYPLYPAQTEIQTQPEPEIQPQEEEIQEVQQEVVEEERPLQIHQEERPPIGRPEQTLVAPPQFHEKSSPTTIPTSPGQQETLGGTGGLMAPPKYKVPQRPVPKKPVGFKPISQALNPFASESENVPVVATEAKEENIAPVHEELPPHHINPTNMQEPIHSTFEEKPPVIQSPTTNEELPPRNLMGSHPKMNAPQNIPINRPPLFNAHHKGKTQKIGKNPFSTEGQSHETTPTTFEPKAEEIIEQKSPVTFEQNQPISQAEEISNEAAENFFDQLAGGPPAQIQAQPQQIEQTHHIPPPQQRTTAQPFRPVQPKFPVPGAKLNASVSSLKRTGANPFANEDDAPKTETQEVYNSQNIQSSFTQQQESTAADISQSFQAEPEKGPEPGKVMVGKSVPLLKKKKAALPGNMFD